MKLSIVIVSYNVKYYLEQCLRSVFQGLEGIEAEVIVVDNHSHDGSVDYLSQRFPQVRFVSSNHNLGFARANNVAIRQARGEYVLLLNPDTIVGSNTLGQGVDFMDRHPDAGAIGVRMLRADGTDAPESRRGIPTPMTAFYKMSGLCARFPNNRRLARYYMSYLPWDSPQQIEIVSGAFCLCRKAALDSIGLLDEDFFMYGEDIDLSFRMIKAGYHNYYIPSAILHYKGESTQKSSFRYIHVFYEAMLIFFRKHYGGMSFLLSVPIKTAIYLKAIVALVRTQNERLHQNLGFFLSYKSDASPVFLFSGKHHEAFRQLVQRKGLEEVDDLGGHPGGYMVYDAGTFSYGDMLADLASRREQQVCIAIFYPEQSLLITPEEVYQ